MLFTVLHFTSNMFSDVETHLKYLPCGSHQNILSNRLFASTWRPLVTVITTLYYVVIIFHHRVWYHELSLRVFAKIKVWASSWSPRLPLCQILFLLRPPLQKNRILSHSINHSAYLMPWEPKNMHFEIIYVNVSNAIQHDINMIVLSINILLLGN